MSARPLTFRRVGQAWMVYGSEAAVRTAARYGYATVRKADGSEVTVNLTGDVETCGAGQAYAAVQRDTATAPRNVRTSHTAVCDTRIGGPCNCDD